MIESKLPNVGTTIFAVMSQLAAETGAINLSQGFPDFPVDPALLDRVDAAMRAGHNQYAPMTGLPALRQKLSAKLEACHGRRYDPDTELTITAGATEALFAAITATVRPGDEVLIFEPAYDSYAPAIELNGGRVVRVALSPPEYAIDWQQVTGKVSDRTRLVIVNNPNNPATSLLTEADLAGLRELAARHPHLLFLSDEVYEHMVYDGARHLSLAGDPVLAERSFVVFSFGKTFHATGWKVGYCAAPPALTAEFRRVHQYLVYAVHTPSQAALAGYLDDPAPWQQLAGFYQQKRDRFRAALQDSRFELLPCRGTYFQLARYDRISALPDTEFAQWLTREHGVAVIPVSVFYADRHDHRIVRFCFAKQDETLDRATERLRGV